MPNASTGRREAVENEHEKKTNQPAARRIPWDQGARTTDDREGGRSPLAGHDTSALPLLPTGDIFRCGQDRQPPNFD